jgi:hypothetical protein
MKEESKIVKTLVKIVLREDGSMTTWKDTNHYQLGCVIASLQAEFSKEYWERITKYEKGADEP